MRVATPGIEDHADALADLVSALDIGTATIVGSSRDCRRLCESPSGGGPLAGSVGSELSRADICGAKRSPENLRRFCMGYSYLSCKFWRSSPAEPFQQGFRWKGATRNWKRVDTVHLNPDQTDNPELIRRPHQQEQKAA
ncbi:hypothetical protein BZM27_24225 [Paraburkholderia steynii]|uniref:Uncharacterized protein n=1 Tax=Paraburkholderia steynii TaxID=1245441 RepID=A0A4R0XI01_9BURK|nr:hypothetical protein BZM27_24225 [Paraburkholderia steynii]